MYYYQIQDVNGYIVEDSLVSYYTGDDAMNAAKDELATRYPPAYPVEIRISDGRFYQGQKQFSSTYYMDAEMVRQHALKRIEEANSKENIASLAAAQKVSDDLRGQFSNGYLTPLDYARAQENVWIGVRFDIERNG